MKASALVIGLLTLSICQSDPVFQFDTKIAASIEGESLYDYTIKSQIHAQLSEFGNSIIVSVKNISVEHEHEETPTVLSESADLKAYEVPFMVERDAKDHVCSFKTTKEETDTSLLLKRIISVLLRRAPVAIQAILGAPEGTPIEYNLKSIIPNDPVVLLQDTIFGPCNVTYTAVEDMKGEYLRIESIMGPSSCTQDGAKDKFKVLDKSFVTSTIWMDVDKKLMQRQELNITLFHSGDRHYQARRSLEYLRSDTPDLNIDEDKFIVRHNFVDYPRLKWCEPWC